jgi:hypothetical protein
MSTFSREEITFFREQYANHLRANARGVDVEGFLSAIDLCIDYARLQSPGRDNLRADFNKIKNTDGNVSWPQFFQALQKIRNTPQPTNLPSQEVSAAAENDINVRGSESNRTRTLRRTLRRGVVAAGVAVGNWFGVTGDTNDDDDNAFFDETAIVESGRRSSFRRARPPPEVDVHYVQDNDIGPTQAVVIASPHADISTTANMQQSSFAFVDFDDDSEESEVEERDDFLVQPPPPNYLDIVEQPPRPVSMPPQSEREPPEIRERRPSFDIPPEVMAFVQTPEEIPQREPGFIYDPQLAFQYYQSFVKEERKALRNRAQQHARSFFGGDNAQHDPIIGGNLQRNGSVRGSGRGDRISARERGWRERLRIKRNNKKLQRQSTMVRSEVESLPTFCPFFTVLITVAQIVCFLVLIILNGLAPVNIRPEMIPVTVPTLATSSGVLTKTVSRSTNMWIGPRIVHMIQWGAKFKPCMRGDDEIFRRNSRLAESGTIGCCCNGRYFGSVVESECAGRNNTEFSLQQFFNTTSCFGFSPGATCSAQGVRAVFNQTFFRPCCVSITGACVVVSTQECNERGGFIHSEAESCDTVNCLRDVCGFNGANVPIQPPVASQQGQPGQATEAPNQFWRWVLPVFFHLGIIHLVLVMAVQIFLGIKIELYAGWLRVGIIYFLSALGGLLVSTWCVCVHVSVYCRVFSHALSPGMCY